MTLHQVGSYQGHTIAQDTETGSYFFQWAGDWRGPFSDIWSCKYSMWAMLASQGILLPEPINPQAPLPEPPSTPPTKSNIPQTTPSEPYSPQISSTGSILPILLILGAAYWYGYI